MEEGSRDLARAVRFVRRHAALLCCVAANARTAPVKEQPDKKILITYFSWGGNTQYLAEGIVNMTGGTLFRIETVNPYPTDYNECTEVAREELDNGVRPAVSSSVENLDDYDVVFVGCPVW